MVFLQRDGDADSSIHKVLGDYGIFEQIMQKDNHHSQSQLVGAMLAPQTPVVTQQPNPRQLFPPTGSRERDLSPSSRHAATGSPHANGQHKKPVGKLAPSLLQRVGHTPPPGDQSRSSSNTRQDANKQSLLKPGAVPGVSSCDTDKQRNTHSSSSGHDSSRHRGDTHSDTSSKDKDRRHQHVAVSRDVAAHKGAAGDTANVNGILQHLVEDKLPSPILPLVSTLSL